MCLIYKVAGNKTILQIRFKQKKKNSENLITRIKTGYATGKNRLIE